jgi:hypothetical protein
MALPDTNDSDEDDLELANNPLWFQALDHLQEEWPEKLADLLHRGKLKAYLDHVVEETLKVLAKSRAKDQFDQESVREQVLPTWVLNPNPNYDPENPKRLSPVDQQKLNNFKSQIYEAAEAE